MPTDKVFTSRNRKKSNYLQSNRNQQGSDHREYSNDTQNYRDDEEYSEYAKGYDKGYDEGYRDGYDDGYADHEYNSRSFQNGHPEDARWHKRKSWSWYWL